MKVLPLAALLLVCTLAGLHTNAPAALAQPLCEVPEGQLIRGPSQVEIPKAQDRSLLPLEYAGRTMTIYLPDEGDFGVKLVIMGSGLPTVEVCSVQGEAFVVISLATGRPIARAANKAHGNQIIDHIIFHKKIQDVFYEETPTPTPSRTPIPVATPTFPTGPVAQSQIVDVAGASIRPPSTGSAGLQ
jgi:hypothetical protein